MIYTLIADDSRTEIDVILYLIKKYNLPLHTATALNGEEALQYLTDNRVDLLITDIRMPFMNGLELSQKALEINPQLKIIISSGYSDFSYAKKAITLGVEEYLLKPIQPEEFINTIQNICLQIEQELSAVRQINSFVSSLQNIYNLEIPSGAADMPTLQSFESTIHALAQKMALEKNAGAVSDSPKETESVISSKILYICEYIARHYKEDLSLEYLAGIIYVHPDYLSRTFKKETGISLNHYIKTTRMNQACHLLETTHQKVSVIGTMVGYQNSAYFIRSFTNHFGISPEKYRQQYLEKSKEQKQ